MTAGSKGTVLVTGGVKRLGKVIAEALRADGWRVLVSSHRADAGETLRYPFPAGTTYWGGVLGE